ncbi:MAG TPA: CarD family transcriptional regulator, partial [Candidatus Baltobacteraceae bacterium]|nr:CarD family transcriptional regulator [Candidatus Baltobacteraceae bacterium]
MVTTPSSPRRSEQRSSSAPAASSGLSPALLRTLAESRSLATLLERIVHAPGCYALLDTVAAVRPFLAGVLWTALRRPMLIVVPTADIAERTFADLTQYLASEGAGTDATPLALVRARDESVGALESPSERSARMSLLNDLLDGRPIIAIAPLAALRQYLIPRELFDELRFTLRIGDSLDFEALLQRLYRLGYRRSDVVAAAGEYAVRGGIIDIFTATGRTPTRIEFFGDEIESIRAFDLSTQRSLPDGESEELLIAPWSEIPRGSASPDAILARVEGTPAVREAVRRFLARGADIPEAWVSLIHTQRRTLLDYFGTEALLLIEEPAMLAAIESGLIEERARETQTLLADVESGELSVDSELVGEVLLAEVPTPIPTLAEIGAHAVFRPTVLIPGAIEAPEDLTWLPQAREGFVLEARPADHFHRQTSLFLESVSSWVDAGETVAIVSSGTGRITEMLAESGISVERSASLVRLRMAGAQTARGRIVFLEHGTIDGGFTIPQMHLRVFGDHEIFGQPPKRVKLRAVKEGVPVTLADLKVGDHVVHAVHGIGQYLGLRTETILGATSDYLDLRYAGTDRMLVPVTQMHQIAK